MSVGRLLATPVHLRHAATHDVLACWFDVDRSTISRAVGEVRPLLAERGCTVSQEVRLRTLAEIIDHLGADGTTWRPDCRRRAPAGLAGAVVSVRRSSACSRPAARA
ncbi:transposase family protein [Streptomyces cyaneofuscatus]|uniref:helix-turn-helix domain-containing protein n=1 Tax=Streptomyces cyaneofuscatus TaxID=66883 RepID=UPI0033BF3572